MTIRWGIIGCGDVARRRVAGAINDHDGSELVSVCRRDAKALAAFAAEFGAPKQTTSDEEVIADPDIDAVYIATPVNLHKDQTIAAARADKHVLVEKPMGMNGDECQLMIDACKEADVRLGVAFYRRFYPVMQRIEELVSNGTIGAVKSVRATTGTAWKFQPGDDGYWRVELERSGGGALMDLGSHRINLLVHLFGKPLSVGSSCRTVAADYSADNASAVLAQFDHNVHGIVECFFGVPTDPDEFSVIGSEGILQVAPLNGGELRWHNGEEWIEESLPPAANFNLPLIADFVQAIHERREPAISGEEGKLTNDVLDKAYG